MDSGYPESISLRVGKEFKKELEKEAKLQDKSLGQYVREIVVNRNEHKNIDKFDVLEDAPIYKITFVDYRQIERNPIEHLISEFTKRRDDIFDGTDGFLYSKLVSIEEIKW